MTTDLVKEAVVIPLKNDPRSMLGERRLDHDELTEHEDIVLVFHVTQDASGSVEAAGLHDAVK
jgi:hypothetical protein